MTDSDNREAAFALQSWLFAHLVQVFQYTGQKLKSTANFWSLMFFILALAMAVFYFLLGFASNSMAMVGPMTRSRFTGLG